MLKPGKASVYKNISQSHGPPAQKLRTTQNPPTHQAGKALGPPAKTRWKYLTKLNLNQYNGPPAQSSNQSHTPQLGGKTSGLIRPKTQTTTHAIHKRKATGPIWPKQQQNSQSPNSGKALGLIRPSTTKTQPRGHKTTTDCVA